MSNPMRGVLYPARLPLFHRLPAPSAARDLVAWFWIPEWDIEPERTSRQEVVGHPALNLVVESEAVTLSGPTTRASFRDLHGRGWAVGALLRPAAVRSLITEPASLIDAERVLDEPELAAAVRAAMDSGQGYRERAVTVLSAWLVDRAGAFDGAARHANAVVDVLMGEGAADSVEEAAARLAVSVRTLQRMAHRYIGVSPAAMIRRRRLQQAAERIRADPTLDLAALAAESGYADHAHLTRDFQTVLGIAPRTYRASSVAESSVPQPQHPIADADEHDRRSDH